MIEKDLESLKYSLLIHPRNLCINADYTPKSNDIGIHFGKPKFILESDRVCAQRAVCGYTIYSIERKVTEERRLASARAGRRSPVA